jgi:hypothetical protein
MWSMKPLQMLLKLERASASRPCLILLTTSKERLQISSFGWLAMDLPCLLIHHITDLGGASIGGFQASLVACFSPQILLWFGCLCFVSFSSISATKSIMFAVVVPCFYCCFWVEVVAFDCGFCCCPCCPYCPCCWLHLMTNFSKVSLYAPYHWSCLVQVFCPFPRYTPGGYNICLSLFCCLPSSINSIVLQFPPHRPPIPS